MSRPSIEDMFRDVDGSNVMSTTTIDKLRQFTLRERELISFRTGTVTVYLDEEVALVRNAEETAALQAMPAGYDISELNGINIGCGDRIVHPSLLAVDITRHGMATKGGHATASPHALLSLSDDLPFARNSLDFVIALHMLEHVEDPIGTLCHWIDKLKPGGGIGLILPDWRYTWDARNDDAPYGHKWNPEPELLSRLWADHLSSICRLEAMQTYQYKLSFDVILRKPGEFRPFTLPIGKSAESGADRSKRGAFLSLDNSTITP